MADRTCAVDGCDNKRDARGWCATHYTRWRRGQDLAPSRNCAGCGTDISGATLNAVYCSRHCASKTRHERDRAVLAPRTCPGCGTTFAPTNRKHRWCTKQCRLSSRPNNGHRVIGTRTCEWCGAQFDVRSYASNAKGCSQSCGNKIGWRDNPKPKPEPSGSSDIPWACCMYCQGWFVARGQRRLCARQECRRAQARDRYRQDLDGQTEAVERIIALYYLAIEHLEVPKASMWRQQLIGYLRSRDGDNCPLCMKPIDFAAKSGPRGSDRGSSIDHVIPKSHGGPDTLTNLRLTCWACNRARGNRGGSEQLLLVG